MALATAEAARMLRRVGNVDRANMVLLLSKKGSNWPVRQINAELAM
jgi:hypothetical protein